MARTTSFAFSAPFLLLASIALMTDSVSAKAVSNADAPNDVLAEIVSIEEDTDSLADFDKELDESRLDDESTRRLRSRSRKYKIKLRVTNLSYLQPFSAFFVMVHNYKVQLFEFGKPASDALATLAEDGNPEPLRNLFDDNSNVKDVKIHNTGAPYDGGEVTTFSVEIDRKFPRVSIAAMAINTNDMFVALDGVIPYPGTVEYSDGLDAGSEENNELCSSIPGPACPEGSGNTSDGNGEGFVHVHRGLHGDFDLNDTSYDWRNPMMKVEFNYY